MNKSKNIGFVSTRIAGTDGVSLEIRKWADVLERNGHTCYYFAGLLDRSSEKSFLINKTHFEHPEIREITNKCFGTYTRNPDISLKINNLRDFFKERLYEFIEQFNIEVLIPENVLSIPLNIPLGIAITEVISETGMPTIAHHHDFSWERDEFLVNAVNDYLEAAFPPDLPSIQHVVINSLASRELCHRKGISNIIIPNVYDFSHPPMEESCCDELRQLIGLNQEDPFILQPTRIIPRKCIERSIEIVHDLNLKNPVLCISHAVDDSRDYYYDQLKRYAEKLNVRLVFINDHIGTQRTTTYDGKKIYTIGDVYQCADLVTYPSSYEGFGNAFLEAVYYRKPIVVNRYSIYITDIEPKGFDLITIDGFVTPETIQRIKEVLYNEERRRRMVEKNYQLAHRYFSYEVLEHSLKYLLKKLDEHRVKKTK